MPLIAYVGRIHKFSSHNFSHVCKQTAIVQSRVTFLLFQIYIIKSGVCGHYDVQLTSPPVLKLWDTHWLPYDLTEVIKLIGERFEPKKKKFSKKYFMSFLPQYCHSIRITVIPSGFLSFLPNIVIPSK
jgi:hypothetical protein